MAEQLGDLTRTHTCGALRPDDVGADVVLLGWVHRVRDLGGLLFVDVRDRAGVTQVVFDKDDEALMAKAKRLRSEFVVGVSGRVRRRSPETVNPKLATGEVEVVVRRLTLLNEAQDAAVSDCRRHDRVGGRAPEVSLPRSAASAAAGQHRPAPSRDDRHPAVLRRERLLGHRDADPDEVDAGRRARLSGAEPRAPGRVLRAAAVAAALQADPDDLAASIATCRSAAASATRTCAPIVSRSSRRWTSRCRLRGRRRSSASSSR